MWMKKFYFISLFLLIIGLSACAMIDANALIGHQSTAREAVIESLTVTYPEDYPEYVSFKIKGYLPESCMTVESIDIDQDENTFEISVVVGVQSNVDCIQEALYFDKEYLLSTEGLPANTYAVTTGEQTVHFLVEDEEGSSGG